MGSGPRVPSLGIVLSVCVILAAHVPTSWSGEADWTRVAWVPFVSPPVRLRDVAQNILLFLPFGYFVAPGGDKISRAGRMAFVLAAAAILSTCLEALQLFVPDRYPSATDVVCNVAGACAGLFLRLLGEPSHPADA